MDNPLKIKSHIVFPALFLKVVGLVFNLKVILIDIQSEDVSEVRHVNPRQGAVSKPCSAHVYTKYVTSVAFRDVSHCAEAPHSGPLIVQPALHTYTLPASDRHHPIETSRRSRFSDPS